MAEAWDGEEGEGWARGWERYDRAVAAHHEVLLAAAAIAGADRVLDVGCGNGQATRDAARAAFEGTAHGIDLSSQMIERARALARAERLANASFEQADAQVHDFDRASYDLAVSRFGAMFFADPSAAFTNIAAGIRPGGRLVMVGWRGLDANEWQRSLLQALALDRPLPTPPPGAPGPFGFADGDLVRGWLEAADFVDVDMDAVDRSVCLGTDAADAFAFFRSTGIVRGMTKDLDDADRARALDALHATMVDHDGPDGVTFGSGAWLITARRPA